MTFIWIMIAKTLLITFSLSNQRNLHLSCPGWFHYFHERKHSLANWSQPTFTIWFIIYSFIVSILAAYSLNILQPKRPQERSNLGEIFVYQLPEYTQPNIVALCQLSPVKSVSIHNWDALHLGRINFMINTLIKFVWEKKNPDQILWVFQYNWTGLPNFKRLRTWARSSILIARD